KMVYTQGLKIYSTMDSTAQKVAVKELKDSSNYPGVSGLYNRDSDGNIVNDGTVLLYNYENFFNDKGNFTLKGDQVKINSDGSVTIKDSKRLNVYTTETNEGTDYSIEFKFTYKIIDGILYSYPGGYVNVPLSYKSLDADGNVVISADFFNDNPDVWKVNNKDKTVTITKKGYSLAPKTIQPQAAMVIVGVGTGEVKAMVGGRTTKGEKLLNRALNPRQSGSSIKPLSVYGAALQRSFELQKAGQKWPYHDYGIDKQGLKGYGTYITTYSSVADERTHIEGRDWPKNAEGGYSGKQTFMTAIQKSINTCAVKIQLQVGAPFSAEMLQRFGLSTIVTDESQTANDMNPAAMALGGLVNGVIPLEMALAYSSFPAGGKVNTPICYTKVVDRDGNVLLEGKSEQSEVMDEGVAWIMTKVLQSVVTNGIAGGARLPEVQSGGKTGTTDDQTDIWFDGFTPSYAAALWIGVDNNVKLTGNSGYAARLWSKILSQCPKALKGTYKAQPANVIQSNGCYFTKGTEIGLDKYAPDDEKKMKAEAEKRAKEAWLLERENHKILIPEKSHTETVHHDAVGHWDPAEGVEGASWIVDKEAYDEQVKVVDEAEHYEYAKGWRDGDFKWDGKIPDDIRRKYGL
ncbi:MAG: hypothetical protein KBS63_05640, partial [Clostridiales bacterium]|nr:hypothetical protein [Candidatus Crickella caballi]